MNTRMNLSETDRQQILSLHELGYGTCQIARRIGRSRKIVRRVLSEASPSPNPVPPHSSPPPSKLTPFQTLLAPTLFGSGLLAVLVIGSEREAHVCRMLVCELEEMA